MSLAKTTIAYEREETMITTITTKAKTIVDGLLPYSPGLLLVLMDRFTGKVLPSDRPHEPQLQVFTLEELCPGINRANIPEHLRDRNQFAKLGQWTDRSGKFVVGLAYTGGSENPWQPSQYIAHNLIAYMILNSQSSYPREAEWTTSTEVYIAEPEQGARQRHLVREKTFLGAQKSQTVYPFMFKLDTDALTYRLNRYNSLWQFPEANVIFSIDWKHTEIQKPDISGIRRVLEVSELMLLVCHQLDLLSIEALRQTCKYIRGMQPLATIESSRLRQVLYRVFGSSGQQSQKQVDQLIKDFNVLLLAGGSIVGGSTPLHVLCPGDWLPADIDIVVRDSHQEAMETFLTEKAGFILNEERTRDAESFYPGGSSPEDPDYREEHIKFTYRRFDNPVIGQPGVDLCVLHPRSIAAPADFVLTYHSTVVMNFWTGRSIYCLWPELTFKGKFIRNEYTPTPKVEAALIKYTQRGFFDIHDPRSATIRGRSRANPFPPRYLQDDYPNTKGKRLTIDMIPGPTWRKELKIA